MPQPREPHNPLLERTVAPFPNRWQRARSWLSSFHHRDYWWHALDAWEARRNVRRGVYVLAALLLLAALFTFLAYPWWTKRNSIKMAREWLAAGRLHNAVESVQQAMLAAPESPEPWQIASELARLGGQRLMAAEYAHHAANLAPGDAALLLAWAGAALQAELTAETEQALAQIPVEYLANSAAAHRLQGELARRQLRLTAAEKHFEAALALDGPSAINEVPLGLILLNATAPSERQRGLDLLIRWIPDQEWGLVALRTLLADAQSRHEPAAMVRWAEALRLHPGFAVGDMPNYLLALAGADEARFASVLAALEKDHSISPEAATQLVSWLNQIGRAAEAVRWLDTLPAAGRARPPLVVAAAESLRQTGDWTGLRSLTQDGNWGNDADFLRWTYGLQAARRLGENAPADTLWSTLYSHAQINSIHAYFAGANLYSWGLESEAVELWWRVAEQEGRVALDALGSLARHYQVHRDAEGQYRVFSRLHLLQPARSDIGNNYSYFAALTKRDERLAEQVARANLAREPRNPLFTATLAFNLFMQNRATESLSLLKPLAAEAGRSPALAFAYGLSLAGTGQKTAARTYLAGLSPASLSVKEAELIKASLGE